MGETAVRAAKAIGYTNAGTVEFIVDACKGLSADSFYFMEMNTRLQVEHPVTEKVSGIDIVAAQFAIAGGDSIADLTVDNNGYAIEVRINAEKLVADADGSVSVRPAPGTVSRCEFPARDDIDVIPAIAAGKTISRFYDSMIAQIIVHGTDREQAAGRLAEYLDEVRIEGVSTNLALMKRVLRDATFLDGDYDTAFLDGFLERVDVAAIIRQTQADAALTRSTIDQDMLRIEGSDELKVLSPTSGIFYLTPSPSEPEYVCVGEHVTAEQTLCQLEAMKLFTPLRLNSFNDSETALYPADRRYEITRINVANGQQVNLGDLLFVVRPVSVAQTSAAA